MCPADDSHAKTPDSSATARKRPRIWAVVADSRRARVFARHGNDVCLVGEIEPSKEQSHAHGIAAWLEEKAIKGDFDRFVLVACPYMLDELRKAFTSSVHARIVAELNKDLTKMNDADLRAELGKILWF